MLWPYFYMLQSWSYTMQCEMYVTRFFQNQTEWHYYYSTYTLCMVIFLRACLEIKSLASETKIIGPTRLTSHFRDTYGCMHVRVIIISENYNMGHSLVCFAQGFWGNAHICYNLQPCTYTIFLRTVDISHLFPCTLFNLLSRACMIEE